MVYLILRKSGKNQVQTKARERDLQEDLMKAKSVTNVQCFPNTFLLPLTPISEPIVSCVYFTTCFLTVTSM